MKKVGIITFYHGSHNYGGLLQAYAMCEVVRARGYDVQQISFNSKKQQAQQTEKTGYSGQFRSFLRTVNSKFRTALLRRKFRTRQAGFREFRDSIPHSKEFTSDTIVACNDIYDIFITGSDQVWNPNYMLPEYLLDFVRDKPKFAYAASVSQTLLTEEQEQRFAVSLSDYIGVSVREKENAEQFRKIYTNVQWVLDPTLLIEKDDWDKIASSRIIKEDYLFCYFIGCNKDSRRMAMQYAKAHSLKIVCIPYFNNVWCRADSGFGDYKLYKVSPNEWISLIKYATCVFTDSFHATVFANIFEKDFFVYNREKTGTMNNRIYSLLGMLARTDRFIDTKEKMYCDYLNSMGHIDYSLRALEFVKIHSASNAYLDDCLKKSLDVITRENQNE